MREHDEEFRCWCTTNFYTIKTIIIRRYTCGRRDRIVVSTLLCGRNNPCSNPGRGARFVLELCSLVTGKDCEQYFVHIPIWKNSSLNFLGENEGNLCCMCTVLILISYMYWVGYLENFCIYIVSKIECLKFGKVCTYENRLKKVSDSIFEVLWTYFKLKYSFIG